MREIRQHGSEGGEGNLPDPYWASTVPRQVARTSRAMTRKSVTCSSRRPELILIPMGPSPAMTGKKRQSQHDIDPDGRAMTKRGDPT